MPDSSSHFEPVSLPPPSEPTPYLTEPILPFWGWICLFIGLIFASWIFILILKKFARRKNDKSPKILPLDQALYELLEIKLESASLQEIATDCSLILRKFLANQFQDSSLFLTHEEFMRKHDSLAPLPVKMQQPTKELLQHLSTLKYCPQACEPRQGLELINQTRQLIKEIAVIPTAPHE